MNQLGLILAEDENIVKNVDVYSHVYNIVKQFVDEYNLQNRKIGSTLSYWLNIECKETYKERNTVGYYFETTVKENLIDHITKNIIRRFKGSIEELFENKCNFTINKGV